ncbi:hypothetical protein GCM10022279_18640 [Comamonas faecalis]|uniref:Uncharacterized protein n=1 Tax=Comamonas faecalis TaxID=1387849 RepID=A0ABP7RCY6_9BURK
MPWRPQGADLYSTGASGAVPVRPVQAVNPVESLDRLGEGAVVRMPEKTLSPEEQYRDWTLPEEKKEAPKEDEEIPKRPPMYQQMIDFIQSMWRASASAIDAAQEVNRVTTQERLAQQVSNDESPTYADPKIKRGGGA